MTTDFVPFSLLLAFDPSTNTYFLSANTQLAQTFGNMLNGKPIKLRLAFD
jgi:hypothetical protein